MGTGSNLPGAVTRFALLLAVGLAGCIDFIEPDLPELGAPAVIQATIRIDDLGQAEFEALLVPGLDHAGLRRSVTRDTAIVLGRAVVPDSVAFNGSRRYHAIWTMPPVAVAEPVTFEAPSLADLAASPPTVVWRGARRLGPDTLALSRGADLVLEVGAGSGPALPEPDVQQWFLRMEGDDGAFGISADGPPPDTIRVPAEWIPAGGEVAIRLTFAQSAIIEDGGADYVGVITLDVRLHWTIRLQDPPPGPAR